MRQAGRRFVEDVRNWRNSVRNYVAVHDALTRARVGSDERAGIRGERGIRTLLFRRSPEQRSPRFRIFVETRLRHLLASGEVETRGCTGAVVSEHPPAFRHMARNAATPPMRCVTGRDLPSALSSAPEGRHERRPANAGARARVQRVAADRRRLRF